MNTMEKLESTYFSKLELQAKERYNEKVKLTENVDPYTLQKEVFTENIVFQKPHIQVLSVISYLLQVHYRKSS